MTGKKEEANCNKQVLGGDNTKPQPICCFDIISQYRSQIMGFAILWIMVFHFYKIVNPGFMSFPVSIGYGGVDIFLFVSGLGLYYSWQKQQNVKLYLIKRFVRVLPAFWIVVLGHDILFHQLSLATISRLSTLGLWLPIPGTYWFISAILAFYVLFPLYMKYYGKYQEKCLFAIFCLGIALMSVYTLLNHSDDHRNDICFFLSRIPIFFIGVSFGKLSYDKREMEPRHMLWAISLSILALISLFATQKVFSYYYLQNTGLSNYPFIVLAPSIALFLSIVLMKLNSRAINRFLGLLGTVSLELYLIHIEFIKVFKGFLTCDSHLDCVGRFLLFFVACFIASYILHILIEKMVGIIHPRPSSSMQ